MPKKKTSQKKKADKQKLRQKDIALSFDHLEIGKKPSNNTMECDRCQKKQKNRAFCYFCFSVQNLPQCAHCGKQKCMSKGGDCLVRHPDKFATGMSLVGAICDHCEAWVCHSRRCLQSHACTCPLMDSECLECHRSVWEHGGRVFRCAFCYYALCEDDQFEHQAMCQQVHQESLKCGSCGKLGQYSCLRCKIAFCDDHVHRKGVKYTRGAALPCPKCQHPVVETKDVSMSTRSYKYGRQTRGEDDFGADDDDYGSGASSYADWAARAGQGGDAAGYTYGSDDDEYRPSGNPYAADYEDTDTAEEDSEGSSSEEEK